MDDFIDPFLPSSSWSSLTSSMRSSWVDPVVSQTNSLVGDHLGIFEGDEKGGIMCMTPTSQIMSSVAIEEPMLHGHGATPSIFIDGNLKYVINKSIFPTENQLHRVHLSQVTKETHGNNFAVHGVTENNSATGTFVTDLNTSLSTKFSHNALSDSGSVESNGSELTTFPQSLGNSHSISSGPTMWPSSYSDVSALMMKQGVLQGFSSQDVESDTDMLRKAYVGNTSFSQFDNLSACSVQDHSEINHELHSFSVGQQIKVINADDLRPVRQESNDLHKCPVPQVTLTRPAGMQTYQPSPHLVEENDIDKYTSRSSGTQTQSVPANGNGCNGATKPRVRARRGQATDPHSIAERLRREKIAERMKNLQELVPNSNKADKASMLDEIIDYVKFLQLQVKVLSMSRLGAAGAVVPLITDAQAERSGSLFSVGPGTANLSESQDNLAFEQEVVKLMESNVTTAMQYLQTKGLCLMPIALASAISSQKGCSSAVPPARKKTETICGTIPLNCKSLNEMNGGEDGSTVKREESTKSNGNIGQSKPNANA